MRYHYNICPLCAWRLHPWFCSVRLVLTRLAGLGDIRKIGSSNIGATNVLRTGRKDLALLTVILDASKAGIAAFIAASVTPTADYMFLGNMTQINVVAGLIAGSAGVIGHNFPVWLKFKGGKGVASTFGFLVATNPQNCLAGTCNLAALRICHPLFFTIGNYCRTGNPFYAFFLVEPTYTVFYAAVALLVLIRHRAILSGCLRAKKAKSVSKEIIHDGGRQRHN